MHSGESHCCSAEVCGKWSPSLCLSLLRPPWPIPSAKRKHLLLGIPQKYLSKQLTALSPKDSLYACTFEGCNLYLQTAGRYLQSSLLFAPRGRCRVLLLFGSLLDLKGLVGSPCQGASTVRPLSFRCGFGVYFL